MSSREAFVFGPFRLSAGRRELLVNGAPAQLGARAFDLLLALVRRDGLVASKDELMAEVWPGTVVEENNLQVQISSIRKVLGDEPEGRRYLLTRAGPRLSLCRAGRARRRGRRRHRIAALAGGGRRRAAAAT